ncbi:MAG: HIT domain-containing protein [Patescibacteria group bacterium]
MDCIFCKIANKEIEKKFIYEDDEVMVFPDIHPAKPVHLLVIPKKHVPEFSQVEDPVLFQKLFVIAQNMVKREGLEDKGYRITINGGGAQVVNHLHVHVMGPLTKTAAL